MAVHVQHPNPADPVGLDVPFQFVGFDANMWQNPRLDRPPSTSKPAANFHRRWSGNNIAQLRPQTGVWQRSYGDRD